jgi:hypothetical protein
MKVYLVHGEDGAVHIMARAEGPRGLIGDMHHVVRPGESWGDLSYEELRALGEGEHDIDPTTA